MSFYFCPTVWRASLNAGSDIFGFWIGQGADAGFSVYMWQQRYIMTNNGWFGEAYTVAGKVFPRLPYDANHKACYYDPTSRLRLCWSYSNQKWVIGYFFPGYEPYEAYAGAGDQFWSATDLPTDNEVAFVPRGSASGTLTVALHFPRYDRIDGPSVAPFGVYRNAAGSERFFGCPRWRDNTGAIYVRSVKKEALNRFSYGSINYDGIRWVIGTYFSETGWWEGEEPQKNRAVIFRFKKRTGSAATGEDLTITFVDYVSGDEKMTAYLGQVPTWM